MSDEDNENTNYVINPAMHNLFDYLARMCFPVKKFDQLDESDQDKIRGHALEIWFMVAMAVKHPE